jgi:hypothetical protein
LMARLGRLPQVGDWVDFAERRITVREVEGRRVGRVLVTAVPPPATEPPFQPGPGPVGEERPVDGHRPLSITPADRAVGAGVIDATAAESTPEDREDLAGRG